MGRFIQHLSAALQRFFQRQREFDEAVAKLQLRPLGKQPEADS